MNGFLQDAKYALRQLARNRVFSIVAISTLALGIGLNTSIFGVFDELVLRPLPLRNAAEIVNAYQSTQNDHGHYRPFSYPEYVALQDSNEALSGLAAYSWEPVEVDINHQDRFAAQGLLVSGNYFSVLGEETSLGRAFLPDEAQVFHALPVVVLSHSFWQRQFHSDKDVVGRVLSLNGVMVTVIGVASPQFAGTEPQIPDFWAPLALQAQLTPANPLLNDRASFWLQLVGRLRPSVSLTQAQARMSGLLHGLAPEVLENANRSSILLTPAVLLSRPDERAAIGSDLLLILAAVSIILLITCINVAGLVLARAATRRPEIGVRLSLGASRYRLIRQLLIENLLIAFAGGVAGLFLAWWLPTFFARILQPPYEQPFFLPANLDYRIFLYTAFLSTIAGVAVGLVPALQASKYNLVPLLTNHASRFGIRFGRSRLHRILVIAETSLCLILLMAAGLLVRALQRAQQIDLGFDGAHVLTASLDLGAHGYNNARAAEFHRQFAERLRNLPGVQSVSLVSLPPLGGISRAGSITVSGREVADSSRLWDYWVVSPNYFETLQIPVLKGRAFVPEDARGNSNAAIVNEAMARDLWLGQNPIGKRFRLGPTSVPFTEVVGVVPNTRGARLWEADKPYVYLPVLEKTQGPVIQTRQLGMKFLIRVDGKPEIIAAMLPKVASALDPNVRVSATPLESSIGRWLWFSRIGALLSGALGLVALMLAAIGIYGLMSYSISQRTREIGIRIALGADRNRIRWLALNEGLRLCLLAIAIGAGMAFPAMRIISGLLYGLGPIDFVSFAGVSLLLGGVAMLAAYLPARRAAKVDPMVALRYE
ncbi:MAG TPA: ABC transporter permease [Terriglobales bacterium]|nr:ABC transporter permease [Terriglobales bacterium]